MHQTVREFFLRPHDAVTQSKFAAVADLQQARRMMQTTCIRYLNVHHEEILRTFHNSGGDWSPNDTLKFVKYLETRPFIRYSLEYLTTPKDGTDRETFQQLPELDMRIQKCPPLPIFCLLKRLHRLDTDSTYTQSQLNSLLAVAVDEGCAVAISNMLAPGADVETKDRNGRTLLHRAVQYGHEATVRVLIVEGKADVGAMDEDGWTALHHAAESGHEATVRVLIVEGKADVEAMNEDGWTALHLVVWNDYEATARVLIVEGKAGVEAKDREGWTALRSAAANGYEAMARMLIFEGKVDVEAKDGDGRTALHRATQYGHEAIVRVLILEGKTDVEAKDKEGRTALYNHGATVRIEGKADVEGRMDGAVLERLWPVT